MPALLLLYTFSALSAALPHASMHSTHVFPVGDSFVTAALGNTWAHRYVQHHCVKLAIVSCVQLLCSIGRYPFRQRQHANHLELPTQRTDPVRSMAFCCPCPFCSRARACSTHSVCLASVSPLPHCSFVNIVKSPLVAGGKVVYAITDKGLSEVGRLLAWRLR
jgi:hypothetical protein